jgi:hypothetical protein
MNNRNSVDTLNIWHYKPWWCQPWSIILTGITTIVTSWLLWHLLWLSIVVAIPISIWWVYFLLVYPMIAQEMMSQANSDRKKT